MEAATSQTFYPENPIIEPLQDFETDELDTGYLIDEGPTPLLLDNRYNAFSKLPTLQIGKLESEIPLVGGGMGVGLTLEALVAAIIQNGGVGTLTALTDEVKQGKIPNQEALAREIKKVLEKCGKDAPLLVNIMYALGDFKGLVKTVIDSGARGLVVGAGLPNDLPGIVDEFEKDKKESEKVELIPIVSGARALRIILKKWKKYGRKPSAVVFENPLMAGGHEGASVEEILANDKKYFYRYALAEIFDVLAEFGDEYMHIPVIAGGGIQPQDLLYLFNLTNSRGQRIAGVQVATPFLTTDEVGISSKETSLEVDSNQRIAALHKKPNETVIIKSTAGGMAARGLANHFTQHRIEELSRFADLRRDIQVPVRQKVQGCTNCLGDKCKFPDSQWCILEYLVALLQGDEKALAFSGRRPLENRESLNTTAEIMQLYSSFQRSKPLMPNYRYGKAV